MFWKIFAPKLEFNYFLIKILPQYIVIGDKFLLPGIRYAKFAHLKKSIKVNPAEISISVLKLDDLESRIVEALPWLIYRFSEMDWFKIIKEGKISDAQNRLGFMLSIAFEKSKKDKVKIKQNLFNDIIITLDNSRLLREDSFKRQILAKP